MSDVLLSQLRTKLTIQAKSADVRDIHGGFSSTWAQAALRYGEIRTLTGQEQFDAGQEHGVCTHEITMRHYGLNPAHRILSGARIFQVTHVRQDEVRNVWTKALVIEGRT